MPRPMKPRPNGSDVQNTVDLSTSVSVGAWMSAAPSPRSAKSGTKIANAMTMLAIPNSDGTSRRARMSRTDEPRDLRHDLGGDLPRNTARRGPLQISRLCGFHRSQGMDDVDVRQSPPPRQSLARAPDARDAVSHLRLSRLSGSSGVADDGYSESCSLIETRPPHRAETTSRHAAQLRCLWNGISKSDANDIAKTTASGTAIASVTRKIGIPDPTSEASQHVMDCHHDR